MNYYTLFEGKTLFNKLWPLLDLTAELELRSTIIFLVKFGRLGYDTLRSYFSQIFSHLFSRILNDDDIIISQFFPGPLKDFHDHLNDV